MKKRVLLATLILFLLTASYAKSNKLVTSWKNPEYSGGKFKKILVVGMSADPGRRSDFEDALSAKITAAGFNAIAGNELLLRPGTDLDLKYLREQIKEHHIDAVILSRLVGVKESITYIPPDVWGVYPYYHTFYGYMGYMSPLVYSPGYLIEEKTVRIETNVYAIVPPDGLLVWTGTSDSFNPKNAKKVISGVVELVSEAMIKASVL